MRRLWPLALAFLLALPATVAAAQVGPQANQVRLGTLQVGPDMTPPTIAVLGNEYAGTALDDGDAGYLNGVRVVTGAQGGAVTSMTVEVGPTAAGSNYQLALYADANGQPGALIAAGRVVPLWGHAWNREDVAATLQPNTAYWLMYATDDPSGGGNMAYLGSGTGAYSASPVPFGAFPATFGPAVAQPLDFTLYATYTPQ